MAQSLAEIEQAFEAKYPKAEPPKKNKAPKKNKVPKENRASKESKVPKENRAPKESKAPQESKVPKENKTSKDLTFITSIILHIILALMVGGTLLLSIGPLVNRVAASWRLYETSSNQVESIYKKGSLIFVKEVTMGESITEELTVGDDIAFISEAGEVVVQRIAEITENYVETDMGEFASVSIDDEVAQTEMILTSRVIGKVSFGVPMLGKILNWLGIKLQVVGVLLLLVMVVSLLFNKKNRASTMKSHVVS